jgi:hypothetical protein
MLRCITLVLLVFYLSGCISTEEVKAPCDYYGTFCGHKIKINQ